MPLQKPTLKEENSIVELEWQEYITNGVQTHLSLFENRPDPINAVAVKRQQGQDVRIALVLQASATVSVSCMNQ